VRPNGCARGGVTHIGQTMFAVIRTGGKQYKVAKHDIIAVEKLAGDPGEPVEFGEVLMIGDGAQVTTGVPLVEGAAVSATVVEQSRAAKIIVFKKKRRHNYRRKKGHRQYQTVLRIDDIRAATGSTPVTEEVAAVDTEPLEAGRVAESEPRVQSEPAIEIDEAGSIAEVRPAAQEEGVSDGS
jgi:large subunit ribosomal protein L21